MAIKQLKQWGNRIGIGLVGLVGQFINVNKIRFPAPVPATGVLYALAKGTGAVPVAEKATAKRRMADFKRRMDAKPRVPSRAAFRSEMRDRPGGGFANLDLVSAASARLHERFRREIGRTEDDPSDRLAGLSEQVGWLREIGFGETDCHFKWWSWP